MQLERLLKHGWLRICLLSGAAGPQAVRINANARIHTDKTARFIAADPSFPNRVRRRQKPAHGIYKINLIYHITAGLCPLPRRSKMRVKSVFHPGKRTHPPCAGMGDAFIRLGNSPFSSGAATQDAAYLRLPIVPPQRLPEHPAGRRGLPWSGTPSLSPGRQTD